MILSLYSLLHVVSAVIWVGGMFFAYNFLRPAAGQVLEPPLRLTLWVAVFKRFFPYVWVSVLLLPATGYLMIFAIWGSMGAAPIYIHIMNGVGIVMILIYMHVFFAPFKRLKRAVAEERWPDGGKALAQIRLLVGVNTALGVLVVIVASAGRHM
ncbi:hypothetical protein MNBD_GAMMA10-2937 [hydrothermal vent metagenome]|uniref:Copper resistance protein D domain-containing protein n=1 Tax=hydrothermal vent metagenome TaxID=652676 RepID=A0A3B0XGP7_9ZZZZ